MHLTPQVVYNSSFSLIMLLSAISVEFLNSGDERYINGLFHTGDVGRQMPYMNGAVSVS